MRADVAPLLVAGVLAATGLCVLDAIGIVRRSFAGAFAALGLAYLSGLAATATLQILLLVVGVGFTLVSVAASALAVALAAAGIGLARRHRPHLAGAPDRLPERPVDRIVLVAFCVLLGLFAFIGLRASVNAPLADYDAWSIWTRKALLLTHFDGLELEFFGSSAYEFMHPDYPLLLPVLESAGFRAAGVADTQALHAQFWIMLVAALWAMAYLASQVTRPVVWAPVLLLVGVSPAVHEQLLTAYADTPAGLFLAPGILALGLWIAREDSSLLALATLMLAGAAATKNEGLMAAAAAILVAFASVLASRGGGRLRPLGLAAAAFALTVLPWRLWLLSHGIEGDLSVGDGLDPGFLAARTGRIGPSVQALQEQLGDQDSWLYLVPFAAALVFGCIATAFSRVLAGFYLATASLVGALLIWAYWISPNPIDFHLRTSANRVVGVIVFVGVAATLHLAGEVEAGSRRDSSEPRAS